MSDSVQVIVDWVMDNGGWEKNALCVTGDHDHYLTLEENFPHALAMMIIHGESHNITPKNNTALKAWEIAISAGRHEDHNKSKTEHIKDFTTWTEDDIATLEWDTSGDLAVLGVMDGPTIQLDR
jgi:alkaline phosphatase